MDGISGITATADISLTGGPVTQTAGANLTGQSLVLLGAGPFTLTNAANDVQTIAANTMLGISYTDANALTVGAASGTTGVTTTVTGAITLATVDGNLTITDTKAGADVSTVGLAVALTAGSAAGQDRALTINANAGVTSGGVTFTADNMSIAAAVNGGGIATLQPFESGTLIKLGGADAANQLGLTDAELDFVTAGTLRIGSATAGNLTVAAAIDAAGTSTLSLISGGSVGMSFFGIAITETNLRLSAGTTSAFSTGSNSVSTLAVSAGGAVLFGNGPTPLVIGTVDGVSGITTSNDPVTLFADALDIQQPINAGTGRVVLGINAFGTAINLGTATGALDLTDAELDRITAGVVELNTSTGAINVSSPISPALTSTLTLSGAAISGAGSIAVANLHLFSFGAVTLNGANDVDFFSAGATPTGTALSFADADGFTFDTVDGTTGIDTNSANPVTIEAGTSTVTFASGKTFAVDLLGTTPGTQFDQLTIHGAVNLNGAVLDGNVTITPAPASQFIIIDNDLADPVVGTFAGLGEGAFFTLGGKFFNITYHGGDGNDVALFIPPLLTVSQLDTKTVTFIDVDGDLVTVKSSVGAFAGDGSEFIGIETGTNGAGQLQTLKLGAGFAGANITITAKRTVNGGNGFVNVGFLDATGVDLGAVSIAGDLGGFKAGTAAVDLKVPGVKSLTVQSIGLLGSSTQGVGGNTGVTIAGALPKLTVKGDLRTSLILNGATDGKLGSATIGGSVTTTGGNVNLRAPAGIGSLKIGGDIRAVTGGSLGIQTNGAIGTLSVGGSIIGTDAGNTVQITAFGQLTSPATGLDFALKSLNVRGSVEFALIFLGVGGGATNADASIGAITVGGDWIASSVLAGTTGGADFKAGNADDVRISGATHDTAALSTIGSITIKGQAFGTAGSTTDMFGIVAERIGKAKVGGRTFAFKADVGTTLNREAFFAAPTLDGAGTENPMFDFTIREIGSLTPDGIATAVAAADFKLGDGKTVTFTDVDGDLVTVKRSVGTFVAGDFVITTAASGGGFLQKLTVTGVPGGAPVNLSITAKPGPGGGNGFVNVGEIDADDTDLGTVVIVGELEALDAGDDNAAKPGIGGLTVQSLSSLAGTPGGGDEITGAHGIGKLTVKTDVRGTHIFATFPDSGNIGTVSIGGSMIDSEISASSDIGAIKIGGSFRDGGRIQATDRIGTISIGGDLIGTGGSTATIEAFAQSAGSAKGLDVALKSLTVRGSVENANVILGRNNNADASLGAISVGREWLASNVLAGVTAGTDTFIGTADDAKVSLGPPIDVAGRFSTISSIIIKGQALGSAATGDSFGIVAEQIGKAKIGAVKFTFVKGPDTATTDPDAFAIAPTGPGATGLPFDFFLREIVV